MENSRNAFIDTIRRAAETANIILIVLFKIGLLFGTLIVFWYCINIKFYPKGLSLGDTFASLFTLASFATIEVFGLIYGGLATLCLIYPIAIFRYWFSPPPEYTFPGEAIKLRKPWHISILHTKNDVRLRRYAKSPLLVIASILLFCSVVYVLYYLLTNHEYEKINLILGYIGGGFLLSFSISVERAYEPIKKNTSEWSKSASEHSWQQTVATLVLAIIVTITMGSPTSVVNEVMKMIGLRKENVFLRLSNENFQSLAGLTETVGLTLISCPIRGSKDRIVLNSDLLWSGIGEVALLRVKSASSTAHVDVEIDAKSAQTILLGKKYKIPCTEYCCDKQYNSSN